MNDENDKPFAASEGDPDEVHAVHDIFDVPASEPAGGDVFEQDIFGAPPPPPSPSSPEPVVAPEPEPPAPEPEPDPPPEPESAKPESDSDVRVVGFDDFDKLGAEDGLKVQANTFTGGTSPAPPGEDEKDDDCMPEFVMTKQLPDNTPPPSESKSETSAPEPEPPPPPVEEAEPEEPEEKKEEGWDEPVFVAQKPVVSDAAVEDPPPATAEPEQVASEPEPEPEPEPEQIQVDDDVKLASEADPMVFKAAKAKEGPEAVQQTQELIEHLDGMDEGFLDAFEIENAVKKIAGLEKEVSELKARIEALEAKLK